MNVRSLRTTQVLVLLALMGVGTRAEAAAPEPDGFAVEDESPPSEAPPSEPPPDDGFAVEDESPPEGEDEGEVIMPSTSPTTEGEGEGEGEVIMPSTTPNDGATPPPTEEEGEWTFEVEDVSEDPNALEEEVKAATVEATTGPAGTVKGRLRDSVTGDPLIGAVVEVVNGKYKTKTDANGEFSLRLPPGIYELRLRGDSSQPLRVSSVEVRQDGTVGLDRELQPLEGANQVVKVQAEMNRNSEGARLLQRKESISARDILSRDEITRSGGGSTSLLAQRIVGCTVVERRYLFCRGLGHRYGNTLFDGMRVPSPEPDLRTIPLDIFPSSALSAINIQKTFTPDVPGDFAGASVQLESREVPEEFTLEVGAKIGANTATTGRTMATNGGHFGADAFGFGNYPRALPSGLPNDYPISPATLNPETLRQQWTPAQTERFGELLPTDTRVRFGSKAPPNFGANATVGWGREYRKDSKIGVLTSASYKNEHRTLREQIRLFSRSDEGLDTHTPQVDISGPRTTFNVAWSGIGLVKWKLDKNHTLDALGFYSRDVDDESRLYEGDIRSVAQGIPSVVSTRLRYVTRSVLMTRLGGKHVFPKAKGLTFDWFGSYARARRDDPQIRDMVYTQNQTGVYTLSPSNGGGEVTYLDLTDDTESGAVNLTMPFEQWGQLESKFKVGAWLEGKQRQFFTRRFTASSRGGGYEIPTGTGDIFGPDTVGGGSNDPTLPNADPNGRDEVFFWNEDTRAVDNYEAKQQIYATYAMIDLPIVRQFKVAGGARFEASRIAVTPFDFFARNRGESGIDPMQRTKLDNNNVLPSVSLIYSPTEKMNVRLVGAQTVARPEFRELAPFSFFDFVGGNTIIGNPKLRSTNIWNADLRWEWFPSASEVVAVSVFYKRFENPIERIAGSSVPRIVTFSNALYAQNVGVELEGRKNLEFLGESFDNWSVGGNIAYIYSRVHLRDSCNPDVDPLCDNALVDASTSRERPLQGQSPYVVNAYIDYTDDDSGTSGRLLYNAFGRRISDVGAQGMPDIYEEAIHNFDLVFGQRLGKRGPTISFTIENILNYPRRFTQGKDRSVTYLAWPGSTFSLGLSYKI